MTEEEGGESWEVGEGRERRYAIPVSFCGMQITCARVLRPPRCLIISSPPSPAHRLLLLRTSYLQDIDMATFMDDKGGA